MISTLFPLQMLWSTSVTTVAGLAQWGGLLWSSHQSKGGRCLSSWALFAISSTCCPEGTSWILWVGTCCLPTYPPNSSSVGTVLSPSLAHSWTWPSPVNVCRLINKCLSREGTFRLPYLIVHLSLLFVSIINLSALSTSEFIYDTKPFFKEVEDIWPVC